MESTSAKRLSGCDCEPSLKPEIDCGLEINEAYWGYILSIENKDSKFMNALQAFSLLVGISFLVVATTIWLSPATLLSSDILIFKLIASAALAAAGIILMHFSTRGTYSELEIDVSLGEIREIIRNHHGEPSLLGRYSFSEVNSVFIERSTDLDSVSLRILYDNSAQLVEIAKGEVDVLERLCGRLARDVENNRRVVVSSNMNADICLSV